jgi:hypothetical protein
VLVEELISEPENNFNEGKTNKFDVLCEGVLTSLSEAQGTVQELLNLKDDLLLHFLPPPMLFRCVVVVGKLYRAFSDLNTPISELTRLVHLNAASWDEQSTVLRDLQKMYSVKKEMLNEAIKRLTLVDQKLQLFEKEKRILNWEKLFIKINEAKGNGRRWKFRMEIFRKKAAEGYEELIRWVESTPSEADPAPVSVSDKKSVQSLDDKKTTADVWTIKNPSISEKNDPKIIISIRKLLLMK